MKIRDGVVPRFLSSVAGKYTAPDPKNPGTFQLSLLRDRGESDFTVRASNKIIKPLAGNRKGFGITTNWRSVATLSAEFTPESTPKPIIRKAGG